MQSKFAHIQFVPYVQKYKKTLTILGFVIGIASILTYMFIAPHGRFSGLQNDLKKINPAENASYTDLDGNVVSLESFKGKPLIINSWASWMPFSQTELPLLVKVKNEVGDSVQILAINRMEQPAVIKSFLSTFSIDTHALLFLVDPTDHFYTAVGGYAMPETLVYDRDGKIIIHTRGTLTEEELRGYVDALRK